MDRTHDGARRLQRRRSLSPMQKLKAVFDLLKPFDVQFLALYGAPKCEPTS